MIIRNTQQSGYSMHIKGTASTAFDLVPLSKEQLGMKNSDEKSFND